MATTTAALDQKLIDLRNVIEPEFGLEKLQTLVVAESYEETLKRFLIARDLDIEKTRVMIANCLIWREKENVDTILDREVLTEEQKVAIRKYYPQGYHKTDKEGNPVWIERTGFVDVDTLIKTVSVDEVVANHVQIAEYQNRILFTNKSRESGRIINKITVIHDLRNLGMHNMRRAVLQVVQKVAAIDQDNYPESLHRLFIVNAPMFFSGTWKLIEVFLNENTKKKIRILGKSFLSEVQETIHLDDIPSFLGGNCKCFSQVDDGGCVSSQSFTNTHFFNDFDQMIACRKQKLADECTAKSSAHPSES